MKKSLIVTACMVSFALLLAAPAALAQADKLIGVWRVTEISYSGEYARTITTPQPGLWFFTKNHYSWQVIVSDKPRPNLQMPDATAEQVMEQIMLPYFSNSGTYEAKGSTLNLNAMVSKWPFLMARKEAERVPIVPISFKFEGDMLILTVTYIGPGNPTEYKLTRLE